MDSCLPIYFLINILSSKTYERIVHEHTFKYCHLSSALINLLIGNISDRIEVQKALTSH